MQEHVYKYNCEKMNPTMKELNVTMKEYEYN